MTTDPIGDDWLQEKVEAEETQAKTELYANQAWPLGWTQLGASEDDGPPMEPGVLTREPGYLMRPVETASTARTASVEGTHYARYRVGASWGITVVREGILPPDPTGHRPDDLLVGVMFSRKLAEHVVRLLNMAEAGRRAMDRAT